MEDMIYGIQQFCKKYGDNNKKVIEVLETISNEVEMDGVELIPTKRAKQAMKFMDTYEHGNFNYAFHPVKYGFLLIYGTGLFEYDTVLISRVFIETEFFENPDKFIEDLKKKQNDVRILHKNLVKYINDNNLQK